MKKTYIVIGLVLVIVAAVSTLAIYKYGRDPKNITVNQALSQRDDALVNLKIQKALNENDRQAVENLTKSTKSLTEQKATLCAQIKAAKLVQPLCN